MTDKNPALDEMPEPYTEKDSISCWFHLHYETIRQALTRADMAEELAEALEHWQRNSQHPCELTDQALKKYREDKADD